MHFVGLATTSRSPIAPCPYRQSAHPSIGGKESQLPLLPPWEHRGPSVLTFKSLSKHFLRQSRLQVLAHQVPCHVPSFKTVFVKHASVLDQLCNHKQAVTMWSTHIDVECCCKNWSQYKKASLNPSDPHWVLSGSLLTGLLPQELAVIAEGSFEQGVPYQEGLPSHPHPGSSGMDQAQGPAFQAQQPYFRPRPPSLATTYQPLNSSHHQINVWWCHLSLGGQTRLVPTDLLPLSLLQSHWDNLHEHFHFRNG